MCRFFAASLSLAAKVLHTEGGGVTNLFNAEATEESEEENSSLSLPFLCYLCYLCYLRV